MDKAKLKSLIQGVIVTTPTPFDKDFRLDLAKTTDITRWWAAQGLGKQGAPLKVVAAGGEGPDLTQDEWQQVVSTTVQAAGKDAVVMCALQTKNTLHTIDDARRAADLGAIGLQIDLPFSHHPNQDDYLRFFTDISDRIDIGIMIYNTWWFGCDPISADTLKRLGTETEHVVAIKWGIKSGQDYDMMKDFSHLINVIDNYGLPVQCHENGGRGFISMTGAAYPRHDLDAWRLLESRKYDEAQAAFDKVDKPILEWRKRLLARTGGYPHMKAFMTAIGKDVGAPRPPALAANDQEIAELKQVMRKLGWIK